MMYRAITNEYYARWIGTEPALLEESGIIWIYNINRNKKPVGYSDVFDIWAFTTPHTIIISYGDNAAGKIPVHSELDVYGQILAVSELMEENQMGEKPEAGNTMMFCLHFGAGKEVTVQKIYDLLKDGAQFLSPLEKCDYSPLNAHIVDKFGMRWYIFI